MSNRPKKFKKIDDEYLSWLNRYHNHKKMCLVMGMTYNKTMNEFIADEKAKEEQNRKYFHDRLYPFLKNNNEFKKLLKQN